MIGFLISLAGRLDVPERMRKAAALATAALALILASVSLWIGFKVWLARHDQQVIAADRAAANAHAAGAALRADRTAGAGKDARDRAFATEQAQLQEDADDAARNGDSPLDALFDKLR